MTCPECESANNVVEDSSSYVNPRYGALFSAARNRMPRFNRTLRLRICRDCDHQWVTVEVRLATMESLLDMAGWVKTPR